MSTKVGEGYIEIKPRLTGFDSSLVEEAKRKLAALSGLKTAKALTLDVGPKIQGVTKKWQAEVQKEINTVVDGLTVTVHVKLDTSQLANGLRDMTIQAQAQAGDVADTTGRAFTKMLEDTKRGVREAEIALKTGTATIDDQKIKDANERAGTSYKNLASNIHDYSNKQVGSIRTAVNEQVRLNNTLKGSNKDANDSIARDIENEIRAISSHVKAWTNYGRVVQRQGRDSSSATSALVNSMEKALDSGNKVLDNLAQSFVENGSKAGKGFGDGFGSALATTIRFSIARFAVAIPTIFGAIGYLITPAVSGISQFIAGLTALASSGFYAAGSLAALPGLFAAIGQAAGVLGVAFNGITDALTALQNKAQHQALTDQTFARSQEMAARQMTNAKKSFADAVRTSNKNIASAESALAKAQEDSATRITDSLQRLVDVKESSNKALESAQQRLTDALASTSVMDAQDRLAQTILNADDRMASAQQKLADTIDQSNRRIISSESTLANAHKRTTEAVKGLGNAYKTAMQYMRDLALQEAQSFLDEEAAKNAIDRAAQALSTANLDPGATPADRRDANLAYREALQRLAEIQARNADLRDEINQANKDGIEGNKSVVDAKQAILDAQQAEIAAEKDLAQTRLDAARDIRDAEDAIAKTRTDNTKQIASDEKSLNDNRVKYASDVAKAEADLADARKQANRDISDAEKAVADERKNAVDSIKQAEENLATARIDGARNIKEANQGVADATYNVAYAMDKVNAQSVNVAFAMSLLSPKAQEFVTYLNDVFIPKLYQVQFRIQDAFYPPIQKALEQSGPALDKLTAKLTTTAGILGGFIGDVIKMLTTDESTNTLGHIMDTNNRLFVIMGEVAKNFGKVILTVADAAGPFLIRMGKLVLTFSKWLDGVVNSKTGRTELADFFSRVGDTIEILAKIVGNLAGALFNVFSIGQPVGQDLLTMINDTVVKFREWTDSAEGKNQLAAWFQKGKDVMVEVGRIIKDIFGWLWKVGNEIDFASILKVVREDLLPAFYGFVNALSGDQGGGLIFFVDLLAFVLLSCASAVLALAAAWQIVTGDFAGAQQTFIQMTGIGIAQTELLGRAFGVELPQNIKWFGESMTNIANGVHVTTSDVGNSLTDLNGNALVAGQKYDGTMVKMGDSAVKLKDVTKTQLETMQSHARDNITTTADVLKQKADEAHKGVTGSVKNMQIGVGNSVYEIQQDTATKFEHFRETAIRKSNEMVGGVGTSMLQLKPVVGNQVDSANNEVQSKTSLWKFAGEMLIRGIIQGLQNQAKDLLSNVANLGISILKKFNDTLGIKSPAKKFIASGMNIGQGAAIGIQQSAHLAINAAKDMSDGISNAWSPNLGLDVGTMGQKIVPPSSNGSLAALAASGAIAPGRQYNITMNAAPSVPTERQIATVLNYADALYGN